MVRFVPGQLFIASILVVPDANSPTPMTPHFATGKKKGRKRLSHEDATMAKMTPKRATATILLLVPRARKDLHSATCLATLSSRLHGILRSRKFLAYYHGKQALDVPEELPITHCLLLFSTIFGGTGMHSSNDNAAVGLDHHERQPK